MHPILAGATSYGAVAVAQLIGGRNSPTPANPRTAVWYARLRKPFFTPPGPVFGLAWTGLDGLLGYAGYRLLVAPASRSRTVALASWSLNLLGIGGFSWVLFGRKRLDEATGVSAIMIATSLGSCAASYQVDRRAALAGLPLALWVVFATVLQEEIWRRNT
jgi:benzodiazapine receptor